jgi:Alw26I/Eco31I/Esp3I family type II restriction endonuclease
MEEIARHPNYYGLPIERKRDGTLGWFAFAKGESGKARKKWAEEKARELGFVIQPGVYAQVMREIHPTKMHVCQICGSRMSIYYHYPSVNFLKTLQRTFGLEFTECDHIGDIWEQLLDGGVSANKIQQFFKRKFTLLDLNDMKKEEIIAMCEQLCRENGQKQLSPGVMSNFPDRYDGFHTYNRCCRAEQDKGRSRENLKSYTKDRRAYEYWSDGNLHAANMFMGSRFFAGVSADHIGPISLGFIHDPRYLRPMTGSDNSTKRDRLLVEDIEAILIVESATGVYPMSWYSADIWEFIKANYKKHANIVATHFRDMLKQSMTNFMFILKTILDKTRETGEIFLYDELIVPKTDDFEHAYKFESDGSFIMTPRNRTERSANEFERFKRIAFTAVDDYNEKTNRHVNADLSSLEMAALEKLCDDLINGVSHQLCRQLLNDIISDGQSRLINNVKVLYMSPK